MHVSYKVKISNQLFFSQQITVLYTYVCIHHLMNPDNYNVVILTLQIIPSLDISTFLAARSRWTNDLCSMHTRLSAICLE